MSERNDVKALRVIEARLQKTERELEAMEPAQRDWVKEYLRRNYGWFLREKPAAT